jgi:thiamine pyrophosphate-dependent acetolactate synthase large subunit-like protein
VLLLGGAALGEEGLRAASRIEQVTGARVLAELWPARQRRGAGVPAVRPLAYRAEDIGIQLQDAEHLVRMATLHDALAGAPAHDVLGLTGLAMGQGLPLAVEVAIACPGRPVVCLEADGSAMYTISALWTHAREQLDVTTVVLNSRSYAILRTELDRVGAVATGGAATRLLELSHPDLDFVSLATGMGVPATRATTAEQLAEQFSAAVSTPGPHLLEAVLSGG